MRWSKPFIVGSFALILSFLFLAVAVAGPFQVPLLQRDSLIGWDYGGSTKGWSITKGRLTGTHPASELLSGWAFGDVELHLRWALDDEGQLVVRLPEVPDGQGLSLLLTDDGRCAQLLDGENQLAPGREIPGGAKQHTLTLKRTGGRLSVAVDGHWLYEVDVDAARRFGLALAVPSGSAKVWDIRAEEPRGKPMFNGKDFAGWWTRGDITKWKIRGNEVFRTARAGDYLRTEKQYGNFTWSFEYKLQKRGNSGLSIRTPPEGWPTADGMELQLLDRPYDEPTHDQPTMAVYGHVPPLARTDKSEQWNRVVVKVEGYVLSAWLNGQLVQHVNMANHPELKHRPLQGWLGFQDHGNWIRVRNVHILEAPEGKGLQAWYRPQPVTGVTAVLDRLINPERLSLPEPITSGTSYRRFSGKEASQQVLADLRGPGAVVRIAQVSIEGEQPEVAFYFDGEKEPRIACPVGQLQATLPPVGKDANPLLTCLPYKSRLRVVLRGAVSGQVRIDYVRFPSNIPVESFTDVEETFPRGWLPAVTTILRWLSSGRFHEYDGLPRLESTPADLLPGARAEMVTAEGAGIVKALKLRADKQVLDSDDLWLEVTVDGEKQPAIAAPVRYYFPELRYNYNNYTMADQGGLTSFLPIPFGDGIRVALHNRGGRTLRGLSVVLAVEQATEENRKQVAGHMRLRGLFRTARQGSDEIIRQSGRGRWVGLVYQLPESGDSGIAALKVDGRPQSGWSADTLDSFLGTQGDFRKQLSGRQGVLCWRYLLLAPVEFRQSLVLKAGSRSVGDRLILFYLAK